MKTSSLAYGSGNLYKSLTFNIEYAYISIDSIMFIFKIQNYLLLSFVVVIVYVKYNRYY